MASLDPALVTLRTERLVLRPWRDADLAPFAASNADPRVRAHFPSCLTRPESVELRNPTAGPVGAPCGATYSGDAQTKRPLIDYAGEESQRR